MVWGHSLRTETWREAEFEDEDNKFGFEYVELGVPTFHPNGNS